MPMHRSPRELSQQLIYQPAECSLLSLSTSVLRPASTVQPTDIADADTLLVMPLTVRSRLLNRAPLFDTAIKVDDIMIADTSKATSTVPAVDVGDSVVAPFGGSATVDDDFCYMTHSAI